MVLVVSGEDFQMFITFKTKQTMYDDTKCICMCARTFNYTMPIRFLQRVTSVKAMTTTL